MLKRTIGRFLLTVLVVTGLAGTIKHNAITEPERKFASGMLKDTRSEVLKSVKGLSEAQLNYKISPESWSIKECMYHIAISEKNLWGMMESTMKTAPTPEKRSEIKMTDEELVSRIADRSNKVKTAEPFEPKNTPYQSLQEAIDAFKSMRGDHIKYMKSTTEDMRNHIVQMPFGSIDCYQLCLMVAAHNTRHRLQIEEVKASSGFPK
jgi:hypothetical protein